MNEPSRLIFSAERLDMVAAGIEHIRAELESPQQLAALLNATIDPGWPPDDYRKAHEFYREKLWEGGSYVIGWYNWYAVLRAAGQQPATVIGTGGYLGPPNAKGDVEIGFFIMPSHRNRGYATEIARFLIAHAFGDHRVNRVLAHTGVSNRGAMKVLNNAGFIRMGLLDATTIRYEKLP